MALRAQGAGIGSGLLVVVPMALACLGVGALFGADNGATDQLAVAVLVLAAGTAGVLLHPHWVYRALAVVLGAVPFAIVPGFGQPVVQVLGLAVWAAILSHPIAERRTSLLEVAVAMLVCTSLASLIVTMQGVRDVTEFVKWLMGTSMVFALLRLDRRELRVFGVVFVWSAWVGAAFAIGIFLFDKAANSLNLLSAIGYGRTGSIGTHLRFYTLEDTVVVRLSGTYVDPNAAGIFMLVAFALAVALLRGWPRIITSPILAGALIISLSRAAIFSLVVGIILYLLFQQLSTGFRLGIVTASIVTAAGAMSVPAISNRILSSFGAEDKGSRDRALALAGYLDSMKGGWWFGLGWGRPEFIEDSMAYKVNYVANSPLLSIYRGGIFVGLAFVGVLIAGAVLAYRQARRTPWESGVIGAVFVGFSLVGLQLDFPVVTLATITMAWSVLIVFLSADLTADDPDPPPTGGPGRLAGSAATTVAGRGGS